MTTKKLNILSLSGPIIKIKPVLQNTSEPGEDEAEVRNRVEFHWGPDTVNGSSNTRVTTCRNSVQGKVLLADDQGN